MKKVKNGLLIILEGGEGVGKSTQAKILVDKFINEGYDAKYFREPGSNKLAENIRNLILYNDMDSTTETLLMSAARNINVQNNILPELKKGNIVVLDRFYKSTMVYQGVLGDAGMKFICDCTNEICTELMYHNIIEFTLLCEPEVAIKRAAAEGHERNKFDVMPIDKYKKINDAYYEFYAVMLGDNFPFERFGADKYVIDTTTKSIDQISHAIKDYTMPLIVKNTYEE